MPKFESSCLVCPKRLPTGWLIDLNRKPLSFSLTVFGGFAIVQGVQFAVNANQIRTAALESGVGVVALVSALLLYRRVLKQQTAEVVMIYFSLSMLCLIASAASWFAENFSFRLRNAAINLIFWKLVPALFGLPLFPSAAFLLWSYAVDTLTIELTAQMHGDPPGLHMNISALVWMTGGGAMCWVTLARLWTVFEAQEAMKADKVLMEKILTMMCDAIVWLSEDGHTMVRTDGRLCMIDVECEQLGDLLDEGERERLQESLNLAKESPVLLPTTLKGRDGGRIHAELFIVWSRLHSGSAFLIGLRCQSDVNEEDGSVESVRSAGSLVEAPPFDLELVLEDEPEARDDTSALSTVLPRSTITGKVFDRVAKDSRLEDAAEEISAQIQDSLEQIARLGRHERWLLSAREIIVDEGLVLGVGGFGRVHGGLLHGSPVAVKSMRYSADSRGMQHLAALVNEIRILRHVRHPNIVLFNGACMEAKQSVVWLVLERIQGPPLQEYVASRASDAELPSRLQLLMDIACALRYLHAQRPQIIHGDLKDSNILVEPALPRARLVDFGLSRFLTCGVRPLSGTVTWMAPEVMQHREGRPRPSADVFSFGRVAYLVVTAQKPLPDVKRRTILELARRGAVPALQWPASCPLSRECSLLCDRLLCLEPERRPDMATVHEEISRWVPLRPEPKIAPQPNELNSDSEMEPANSLSLPGWKPTRPEAMRLTVMNAAMHWNVAAGGCCAYHTAIEELQVLCADMREAACKPLFRPHSGFQCGRCGILDVRYNERCHVCGYVALEPRKNLRYSL